MTDEYHGQRVEDPYRWLEDPSSPETRQFVADQNAHTRRVLEEIPGRDVLRKSVEQLLTIGRVASPRIGGNNYFMSGGMAGKTRQSFMCGRVARARARRVKSF